MPCDSIYRQGQDKAARDAEIARTLKDLERRLREKSSSVIIGPNGAVGFQGWSKDSRNGVSDVCAFRSLMAQGSWELRQAIATAEAQTGRQVNPQAVAAGTHSHDGGKTWHGGHK